MKWCQKITAGSLQFVLFIGVVIALLLLTFVTLAHSHSFFGKKTVRFVNTVKAADFGLATALKTQMSFNDSTEIEIPFENQIRVRAIREYWGVLEKYTVVATAKKNHFTKSVLVGSKSTTELPALYLQDNERPMIIVGKAKIRGNVFLPKQGIRPGNISGNSFYGASLVSGRQLESNARLPELDSEFQDRVQKMSKNWVPQQHMETLKLSRNTIVHNSFKHPTKVIQGDNVMLFAVSLKGNIIVHASRRIVVDASSSLKDVVLIAPEIIIKDRVSGTFQAIASKHIEIGQNCHLAYPSALVVSSTSPAAETSKNIRKSNIILGPNSLVKGFLMYLGPKEEERTFSPQIKVDNNTDVWGEIYCHKNLELKGNVIGSVSTSGFMALENGSIYQNHLFNGTIDIGKLPQQYVGLPLRGNKTFKAVVKWLY
ncbi:hypothetical protein [Spongiimicrobium sp. 3-5]|uniref:hypothetical protein n=1 Tax=Spongiimicrobium sp. 3-5 TaxID=3332596 RepID=UPI00397F644C